MFPLELQNCGTASPLDDQLGMSATTVGDKLGITGMAVGKCVDRAEKRLGTQQIIAEYPQ